MFSFSWKPLPRQGLQEGLAWDRLRHRCGVSETPREAGTGAMWLSTVRLGSDDGGVFRWFSWEKRCHEAWTRLAELRNLRSSVLRKPHKDPLWVRELVESSEWQVVADYSFRDPAHINVNEGRSIRTCANAITRRGGEVRSVKLADSQVMLGSSAKGRSSSSAINEVLRPTAASMAGSNSYSGGLHAGTKWNPADDPTRNVPVRDPSRSRPRWFVELSAGAPRLFDQIVMSDQLKWPLSGWCRILGSLEESSAPLRGPWAEV
jgi:hypothetical protein